MKIIYREFENGDEADLAVLMVELGYAVNSAVLKERIQNIHMQNGAVLLAVRDGKVVGCVNVIIDVRLAEGKYGEIVSLIVTEKIRGCGVGKQLIQLAETWLTPHCDTLRVRANAVRKDAHGFYGSLGYQEFKTQKVFVKSL